MAITNETLLDPSIDRRLAVDIDAAEGDSLVAYPDTRGVWTCGRGHEMPQAAPGRSWEGFTVIQSTSDGWLSSDIISARNFAMKLPEYVSLDTGCRQNAVIELCFNMRSRWGTFVKARACIQAQDWQGTHDNLLDSDWAREVQPHGLDRPGRATRIANYLLTGQYP